MRDIDVWRMLISQDENLVCVTQNEFDTHIGILLHSSPLETQHCLEKHILWVTLASQNILYFIHSN